MSTQKRKFELFARLQALGFTYDEAASLRRIEMTLQRWGELECGTEGARPDWTVSIERDEATGKPSMRRQGPMPGGKWIDTSYPVADREAGAIKRLGRIVAARNERSGETFTDPAFVTAYHQTDCRGCNLYLLTRKQIGTDAIDTIYNRGLAVIA